MELDPAPVLDKLVGVKEKLERVRGQYEHQVQNLKDELERERAHSADRTTLNLTSASTLFTTDDSEALKRLREEPNSASTPRSSRDKPLVASASTTPRGNSISSRDKPQHTKANATPVSSGGARKKLLPKMADLDESGMSGVEDQSPVLADDMTSEMEKVMEEIHEELQPEDLPLYESLKPRLRDAHHRDVLHCNSKWQTELQLQLEAQKTNLAEIYEADAMRRSETLVNKYEQEIQELRRQIQEGTPETPAPVSTNQQQQQASAEELMQMKQTYEFEIGKLQNVLKEYEAKLANKKSDDDFSNSDQEVAQSEDLRDATRRSAQLSGDFVVRSDDEGTLSDSRTLPEDSPSQTGMLIDFGSNGEQEADKSHGVGEDPFTQKAQHLSFGGLDYAESVPSSAEPTPRSPRFESTPRFTPPVQGHKATLHDIPISEIVDISDNKSQDMISFETDPSSTKEDDLVNTLKAELEQTKEALEKVKTELCNHFEQQIEDLKAEHQRIIVRNDEDFDLKFEQLQKECSDELMQFHKEFKFELENEVEKAKEFERKIWQEKITELEKKIEPNGERQDSGKDVIGEHEEAIRNLKSQIADLTSIIEDSETEIGELKQQLNEKGEEISNLQQQVGQDEQKLQSESSSGDEVEVLEQEIARLKEVIQKKDAKIDSISNELKEKSDAFVSIEKQLDEKHQQIIKKINAEHTEECDKMKDDRLAESSELQRSRDDLVQELDKVKSDLEQQLEDEQSKHIMELEQAQRNLEVKLEEVTLELQSKHKEEIEKLKQSLNETCSLEVENVKTIKEGEMQSLRQTLQQEFDEKLNNEKKEVENRLCATQIVQNEIMAAQKRVVEEELESLKSQLQQLETERQLDQSKLENLEAELQQRNTECQELEDKLDTMGKDKYEMAMKVREYEEHIQELEEGMSSQEELEELQEKLKVVEDSLKSAKRQVGELGKQLSESKEEFAQVEHELKRRNEEDERRLGELNAENEGMQKTLEEKEKRLSELNGELEEMRGGLVEQGYYEQIQADLKQEINKLNRELTEKGEEAADLERLNGDLEKRTNELDSQLQEKQQEYQAQIREYEENIIKGLENRIQQLEAQLDQDQHSESGASSADEKVGRLEAELAILQQEIKDKDQEIDGLRREAENDAETMETMQLEYSDKIKQLSQEFEQKTAQLVSQQEIQVPAEQTIATTAPTMADTTGGESEAEADSQSESRTPTRDMDTSLPADTEAESRQEMESQQSDWSVGRDGDEDGELSVEQLRSVLSQQFEAEKTQIVGEYEERIRAIQERQASDEEVAKKYEEELEKLKTDQLEQIENVKVVIKEELLSENVEKIKEMTEELEQTHRADVTSYEEKIQLLENELKSLKETSETDSASTIDLATHTKELDELKEKHSQELDSLMDLHQNDMQQMQKKFKKKMDELQDQPEDSEVERLRQEKDEEIDKIVMDYEMKLSLNAEDIRKQCERQKEEEIQDTRQRLEGEIQALRTALEASESMADTLSPRELRGTLVNPQDMKTAHVEQMNAKNEEIEKLQRQLYETADQIEKQKEKIAELETHIEEQIEDYESRLKQQKDEYEVLLGQRERDNKEGDNLIAMLRIDLDRIQAERDGVNTSNENLLRILSDTVKTNLTTEDKISRRLVTLVSEGQRRGGNDRASPTANAAHSATADRAGSASSSFHASQGGATSMHGGDGASHHDSVHDITTTGADTSQISVFSDEGLDLSQRISESMFVGPDLEPDSEEVIYDAANRLQNSVERLLDMIADTTRQLHQAQTTQRELLETVSQRSQSLEVTSARAEELDAKLKQETEAKEFLALELNKAEGLLQGYSNEKHESDQVIQQLEEKQEALIKELEHSQMRLVTLEEASCDLAAREDDLRKQREAIEKSVGNEEQDAQYLGLINENTKLNEEKRELEKMHKQDKDDLDVRVREMLSQQETLQGENEYLQEEMKTREEDHQKQIENLEKQLKANKQFLEDQTIEREQERDEYQQQLQQMRERLKEREKKESAEYRLQREVQDLETQLKEKIGSYSEVLLKKDDLERDLLNREVEIKELRKLCKELENQIDSKTRSEAEIEERLAALEQQLTKQQTVNEELSTELKETVQVADHQKTINDLEAQLETLRRSEQVAEQQIRELEEEVRNLRTLEEELTNDKNLLQNQVYDQMNQISTLKSEVNQLKFGGGQVQTEQIGDLKETLNKEREIVEEKERQISNLNDQLDTFREEIVDKTETIQHLQIQMDVTEKESRHQKEEFIRRVSLLEDLKNELEAQVQALRDQVDSTPMPQFAQNLINEKNNEIDHLNAQIEELKATIVKRDGQSSDKREVDRLMRELQGKSAQLEDQAEEIKQLHGLVQGMKDSQNHLTESERGEKDRANRAMDVIKAKAQEELEGKTLESLEKDHTVEQLELQVESLQKELHDLRNYQQKFQDDFDEVQTMLNQKQQQVEELTRELARVPPEGITQEMQEKYDGQIRVLEREIHEKQNVIDEKEEENYVLNEKQEELSQTVEIQEQQIQLKDAEIQTSKVTMSEKECQIERQSQELMEKEKLMREQDSQISTLQQEMTVLKSQLQQQGSGDPGLSEEVVNLREKLREEEVQINLLKASLTRSEKKEKETNDQLNVTLSHLTAAQQHIKDQEQQYSEQITIFQSKKGEVERLRAELTELKNKLAQFQDGSIKAGVMEEEMEELKRSQQMETLEAIRKAQDEHSDKLKEVTANYERQMKQLQDNVEYEKQKATEEAVKKLTRQHQEEIRRLINEHRKEIDAIQSLSELTDIEDITSLIGELRRRVESEASRDQRMYSSMQTSINGELEEDDNVQALLKKVREEGMKALSLSEQALLHRHGYNVELEDLQRAWNDEKASLLSAINSLKELLAETHKGRDPSKMADADGKDWRADLVKAVHNVFADERDQLGSEIRTFKIVHSDKAPTLEKLEQKLKEQELRHNTAMQKIYETDRQSLLNEVRDLRQNVTRAKQEKQEENNKIMRQLQEVEEQYKKRDRQWQKKVELGDYKLQQERVISDDLRSSLEIERSRCAELASQLSRERSTSADMRSELTETQIQTSKMKDSLEREQARLLSASTALEDERHKSTNLTEALANEKASNQQYIQELETEKLRSIQYRDRTSALIEKLKHDLEMEKDRRAEIEGKHDKESLTISSLRRELQMEKDQHHNTETRYKAKVAELKSEGEVHKAKIDELNRALQQEQEITSKLRDTIQDERHSQQDTVHREQVAIADLQAMVDLERSKMMDMQRALEREKIKVQEVTSKMDIEKSVHQGDMEQEKQTAKQLRSNLELLQAEDRLASERAQFEREKSELCLRVQEAEGDVVRLRQDLNRAESELEKERDRLFSQPTDLQVSADKDKMQRLYGKYLRAESFRKALVYQKKYLLLLLGGFRDCEQDTLAMLAQMGAHPTESGPLSCKGVKSRPVGKFRSAVRAVIAISRLKFLVKKWKRATRAGSSAVAGNVTSYNGASYVPQLSAQPSHSQSYKRSHHTRPYSASPHRHTGYSDTPVMNGSSTNYGLRSGTLGNTPPTRDIDPVLNGYSYSTDHRHSPTAKRQLLSHYEGGHLSPEESVTASEMDMEESLNDYIKRLETLQTRLGTVTSSSRGPYSQYPRR